MNPAAKSFWTLVIAVLAALAGISLSPEATQAAVSPLAFVVGEYGAAGGESCTNADSPAQVQVRVGSHVTLQPVINSGDVAVLPVGDSIILCINATDGDGTVVFDAGGVGEWSDAACGSDKDNDDDDAAIAEFPDDACLDVEGDGSAHMEVLDSTDPGDNDLDIIILRYTCSDEFGLANVTIAQGVESQVLRFTVFCETGPPASITVVASPTNIRCGELVEVTATVKDADGKNVSDHTPIEFVSNLGSVIGGTGAVAASAGPIVPVSSTIAGTFDGKARAILLTSAAHSGPYIIIATAAGPILGGLTPPISSQFSFTCSIPVTPTPATGQIPAIAAPRTGQGSVSPPSVGDAGLLDESGRTGWALFAASGLALGLAGFALRRLVKS